MFHYILELNNHLIGVEKSSPRALLNTCNYTYKENPKLFLYYLLVY